MSAPRDFTLTFAGGETQEIQATGHFVGIIEAPLALLDLQLDGGSAIRRAVGGSIFTAGEFRALRVTSSAAQTVRILIADERQDNFAAAITAGWVEAPSSAINTPVDNAIAAATTETIAANAARRRITIGVLSTATVGVRIRHVGASGGGLEIQPGTFAEIKTTAALEVRNNDASTASSYWVLEES